jgi:hypothetical protein
MRVPSADGSLDSPVAAVDVKPMMDAKKLH